MRHPGRRTVRWRQEIRERFHAGVTECAVEPERRLPTAATIDSMCIHRTVNRDRFQQLAVRRLHRRRPEARPRQSAGLPGSQLPGARPPDEGRHPSRHAPLRPPRGRCQHRGPFSLALLHFNVARAVRANAFTLRASRINRFAMQPVSQSAGGIDRRAQTSRSSGTVFGVTP